MRLGDNPVIYLAAKQWEYSKGDRRNVVLFVILSVIANAVDLFETLVVALLLNTIQTHGVSSSNFFILLLYLALIPIITVVFWAFHGPSRVLEITNAFLVRANYKRHLLSGTMALPVEWHTDHHSGDTIDKIEKGTNALYTFSGDTFMVINAVVSLLGSYIALTYFHFSSLYIVFGMVAVTIWIIITFDKTLIGQYKELFKAENTIAAKVYDALSNITTVIILRVEKLVLKAVSKRIMQPLALFIKNIKLNEVKWFLVSLCSAIMTFFVLGSYVYGHVRAGTVIVIGTVYALYGYVRRINELFFRFAYMYGDIVRQRTAVMNAEEISKEFKKKMQAQERTLGKSWRELSIQSLSFSYHTKEGADLHLDAVSLSIKKGEKVALVGASGSGKTTLLKIMRGLYEPKQLRVFVDGEQLKNGFATISHEIALIP
jgi:ABC-type multidrug transport system fused ATPase/permease subunit